MPPSPRAFAASTLLIVAFALPVRAADPGPATDSDLVTLRGRVICLEALEATLADPAAGEQPASLSSDDADRDVR